MPTRTRRVWWYESCFHEASQRSLSQTGVGKLGALAGAHSGAYFRHRVPKQTATNHPKPSMDSSDPNRDTHSRRQQERFDSDRHGDNGYRRRRSGDPWRAIGEGPSGTDPLHASTGTPPYHLGDDLRDRDGHGYSEIDYHDHQSAWPSRSYSTRRSPANEQWDRSSQADGQGQGNYPSFDSQDHDYPHSGRNFSYQGGRGMRLRERWQEPGPHSGRGPKGYRRSDQQIAEEINQRLMSHGHVDASDVQVSVSSGVVTLTGKVEDRRAKREAEDCADGVHGVEDVMNQLSVEKGFFASLFSSSDDQSRGNHSKSKNS